MTKKRKKPAPPHPPAWRPSTTAAWNSSPDHQTHLRHTTNLLTQLGTSIPTIRSGLTTALDLTYDWANTQPTGRAEVIDGVPSWFSAPENATIDQYHAGDRRDHDLAAHRRILDLIRQADTALVQLRLEIARAHRLEGEERRAAWVADQTSRNAAIVCRSLLCDELVDRPGFCPACAEWLEGHPGTNVVPGHVITARGRKQRQRERDREGVTPFSQVTDLTRELQA